MVPLLLPSTQSVPTTALWLLLAGLLLDSTLFIPSGQIGNENVKYHSVIKCIILIFNYHFSVKQVEPDGAQD